MRSLVCLLLCGLAVQAQGIDATRLAHIDAAVAASIKKGDCPGAVVVVVHRDAVVFRKAYGQRALQPKPEPMTTDTIFDLASLTKPVATATAAMLLVEQGKLRLSEKVATYWPEFAANKKDQVTVEHLLLHTSGLTADNALADYKDGNAEALKRVANLTLEAPAGERFRYSDVGFIVLGHLVERLSGQSLNEFTHKHIFAPLKMIDTGFLPDDKQKARCALTAQRQGEWLRGVVHDPRSAAMGGVAGHAGLFGSADDLARFARMLLHHGRLDETALLGPRTTRLFTTSVPVPGGARSRGWDVDTSFSSPRGELFTKGEGFGHTGFTGTSLWVDPASETAIIILTNRVHLSEKVQVTSLRREIANIVAGAVQQRPLGMAIPNGVVANGIDVLVRDKFSRLKGIPIGLVTNHTGLDRAGTPTIDLLHQAPGVKLVALFSPEHGIRGELDQANIGDTKDAKTGLPVFSLYGKRRKPDAETLKGIELLVFDIQDIGCRFYTYISTLKLVLEAAAEHKVKVLVLDRPNPLGGIALEGPLTDEGRESFIAAHSLPLRHGMTIGELAKMFVAERKLAVELDIVKMEGWQRRELFDRTGLAWVNPSPNMRNLTAAMLYPGIGLMETTNISVGRGTDRPFEWIGAPWIDSRRLAEALTRLGIPGLRFVPLALTPSSSVHQGKRCGGVQIIIDDWKAFVPVRSGLLIAATLRDQYPEQWETKNFDRLLVHKTTYEAFKDGQAITKLEESWRAGLKSFRARRQPFLLYAE